jgi:hypothetical protein
MTMSLTITTVLQGGRTLDCHHQKEHKRKRTVNYLEVVLPPIPLTYWDTLIIVSIPDTLKKGRKIRNPTLQGTTNKFHCTQYNTIQTV